MKKILFIHHATVSVGAGLSALHLLSNIPRNEYTVVVSLPQGGGDLQEKIESMNIKVRRDFDYVCSYTHVSGYHYPFFSISHFHNIYEVHRCRSVIKKVLQEEKPDLVLVNSMTLFWIGKIGHDMNIKTVCFHRETYYHGTFGLRTKYIKHCLNRDFDRIVFLSKYDMKETGSQFEKYIKITDKVDNTKYSPLDKTACRKELQLPMSDKLILYMGGISKLKGIETVLMAINKVKTEAKLIILQYDRPTTQFIGISGLRQRWRRKRGKDIVYWADQYINENHMWDKLIVRGRTDEVEKYLVASDMVVFPSQEPHQARPIYEAGTAKRPIVVSDFENTREFLDETNGWCVDPKNADAWARTIDEILSAQDSCISKVDRNYEKSIQENNINSLNSELSELLSELEYK